MAFLPSTPLTLHGGCFCGAAKYTIHIPGASERPALPGAVPARTSPTTSTPTTFPITALDHCTTCRRISGAIITCWLVLPPTWVTWDVVQKPTSSSASAPAPSTTMTTPSDGTEVILKDVPTATLCGPPPPASASSPSTFVQQFRSSERAMRTFCSRCGTHLAYYHVLRHGTASAMVDITVGSLDEASVRLVRPERHNWWDSGVDWIREMLRWGTGGWLLRNSTGDPRSEVRDGDKDQDDEEGRRGEEGAWLKMERENGN